MADDGPGNRMAAMKREAGPRAGWQQRELGQLAELRGRIGWRGLTAKEYTESGPLFLSVHSLNYGAYVDFRDAFHITWIRRIPASPEAAKRRVDRRWVRIVEFRQFLTFG